MMSYCNEDPHHLTLTPHISDHRRVGQCSILCSPCGRWSHWTVLSCRNAQLSPGWSARCGQIWADLTLGCVETGSQSSQGQSEGRRVRVRRGWVPGPVYRQTVTQQPQSARGPGRLSSHLHTGQTKHFLLITACDYQGLTRWYSPDNYLGTRTAWPLNTDWNTITIIISSQIFRSIYIQREQTGRPT